jgi:hypothetical protein
MTAPRKDRAGLELVGTLRRTRPRRPARTGRPGASSPSDPCRRGNTLAAPAIPCLEPRPRIPEPSAADQILATRVFKANTATRLSRFSAVPQTLQECLWAGG